MISPCRRPTVDHACIAPLMDWLSIAGALFLVWLVLVFLFTPGINYHLRQPDVGSRPTTSSTRSSRPARRRCTTATGSTVFTNGAAVLSGDARRDPRRDALDQHGVLHLPAGKDRRPVHRRRCRSARGSASTSRSSSTRSAASASGAGRCAGCARRAAASSRISGCEWYSLARLNNRTHRELLDRRRHESRSPAAPGSPTGGCIPQQARSAAVARHDGAHRRAGRRRAAGRRRRELARVLRRDPDRAGVLSRPRAGGRHDRVRRQELAVGSRDGVARGVSAADGGRGPSRPHHHAVLPARPRAAARARRHRAARRRGHVIVPGPADRSAVGRLASRRMWGQLLEAGVRISRIPRAR